MSDHKTKARLIGQMADIEEALCDMGLTRDKIWTYVAKLRDLPIPRICLDTTQALQIEEINDLLDSIIETLTKPRTTGISSWRKKTPNDLTTRKNRSS